MSDEADETGLVRLEQSELAKLIPASPDAMLSPFHADSAEPERGGVSLPYVAFRGAKSLKYTSELDAAGIKVDRQGSGVFYLMDPPTPIRVDPFQLHIINYARAYTQQDENGNVTAAKLVNDDEAFSEGFRETIFAPVIVVTAPGEYVAATLQLRGAQTNALRSALQLLGDAKKPGRANDPKALAAAGPAWAEAAKVTFPGGRFRLTIFSTAETPQNGGQKFNQGHGESRPTPKEEVEKLNQFRIDHWGAIQKVMAVNNARFEKVRRLAIKQAKTAVDPIPF